MFSATFNDDVISRLKNYVGKFELFPLKKEALKLKGVKNFKILLNAESKVKFIEKLFFVLQNTMTMIFVNKKQSAITLQERLAKMNIQAKILMGGMEIDARDQMID
jgi:superfamily II DNA/RNA helicase